LSGYRLLVYGTPSAEQASQLVEAVPTMPIRFTAWPRSSAVLARQLNEEVDVVVLCASASAFDTSYVSRVAIASGVPVLSPNSQGHAELTPVVTQVDDLTTEVVSVCSSPARRRQLAAVAQEFCAEGSWSRIAALHQALWEGLAP
jgi:hypothetical protein